MFRKNEKTRRHQYQCNWTEEILWKIPIVRTYDISYHENDAIVQITVGENAIIKLSPLQITS